jgi:hypothetical protein
VSALAEALVAAQRRALAAVEKQYAAGKLETDDVRAKLTAIGLADDVDADRLIAALDLIREYGAALPAEPANGGAPKGPEPATDAQLALIARLVSEKNVTGPDHPVTKQEAHAIIDSLKNGSYDPATWRVPF